MPVDKKSYVAFVVEPVLRGFGAYLEGERQLAQLAFRERKKGKIVFDEAVIRPDNYKIAFFWRKRLGIE